MGQSSGAVVVLPGGESSFDKVCRVAARELQPGVSNPVWEIKSRSKDGKLVVVDPDSTQFFSMLTWMESKRGYPLLKLTFDTNALYDEAGSAFAVLESYLWSALLELHALFGYVSQYEHHLERDWLDRKVVEPLAAGRFKSLPNDSYDLVLLSNEAAPDPDTTTNWSTVRTGPAGLLLRNRNLSAGAKT